MRQHTTTRGALAGLAAAIAALGLAAPAHAAFPGENGRIAFASFRDALNGPDIWTMRPDGTELVRLTDVPGIDREPAVSPDGRRIAFTSARTGRLDVYVMDAADGGNLVRVTDDPGLEFDPAWSPDGRRLVFTASTPDGLVLQTIAPDGSGRAALPNPPGAERAPDWSPDGRRIAYASTRDRADGGTDLHVLDLETGEATRLTTDLGNVSDPSWSPDGTQLAFSSFGGFVEGVDLFAIGADGGGLRLLNSGHPEAQHPSWSPDGLRIAYSTNFDLAAMDAAGGGVGLLTTDQGVHHEPSWGPVPLAEQLRALADLVRSLGLPAGTEQSLLAKVDAAAAAAAAGDEAGTCTALADAERKVLAQDGKKLTEEQAGVLLAAVRRLQQAAGCAAP